MLGKLLNAENFCIISDSLILQVKFHYAVHSFVIFVPVTELSVKQNSEVLEHDMYHTFEPGEASVRSDGPTDL